MLIYVACLGHFQFIITFLSKHFLSQLNHEVIWNVSAVTVHVLLAASHAQHSLMSTDL